MNGSQGDQFGPGERIAAFAKATEVYAETLEDPDLANVYFGKSLGLWQALTILRAEERIPQRKQSRGPAPACGPRRADRPSPPLSARRAVRHGGGAAPGW
jgi:hypothetical protein